MQAELSPLGRIERILLATDGSGYSVGAVAVAIALAGKTGARLTALTAVLQSPELDAMEPGVDRKVAAEAGAILDQVVVQAATGGVDCARLIKTGNDPYREILAGAEEVNADLLVLGRRGRRGLARMMLGDATAKVIGHAPCDVLVVPEAARLWSGILVAVDGSRFSDAAAVAAARMAQRTGAPLTVLSVEVPDHSDSRRAEAGKTVDRVLRLLSQDGVKATGTVERGATAPTIVATAAAAGADLIVMGTHGRTGLGRLLFGSNAERVINQAGGSVLVVKG
ncbi:MAG: universal stress protein [Magnetospirillum sp.]|nr:universal stress protein [Magnetospirillum sp.]